MPDSPASSDIRPLDPFLAPQSVAIVGLSRSAIGSPVSVLTTLSDFGYPGRVYVVNPSMSEAPGARVCAKLSEIPETVDLAVISVERSRVPATLEECAAAGIGAAIVITQGFADADAEGQRLQEEISEILRCTGLRIVGPNTIGVVNALARFTSSFIEVSADDAPVGQVAQSGFLMMGHHLITNEPAGYCMSVDLGNACDIGLIDVLEHYEAEPAVRVIECHAEAIDDGPAFMQAARRITRAKPMVALKAGASEAGQAAVASHTGAVAGQARVYQAAFRQAGVVQAESAEELRLFTKAFATYGEASGRRVAVMSFSGGGAVLAIDAIERAGLALASLSETTKAAVADLFPDWMEVHNPLDIWIPVSRDLDGSFPRVLEALLADEGVDAVLCIYCSYNLPKYDVYDASGHIRELSAAHRGKPVVCWSYGQDIEGFTRRIEAARSAMVFPTLDGAARALAALADHGERRRAVPAEAAPASDAVAADAARAEAVLGTAREAGQSYLFTEAMEILEAYGLPVAPWRLVREEGELAAQTAALSAPLCLKVVSADVVHKSDSGGVVLGVAKGEALADAYREMTRSVQARVPGAKVSGVLVQEMAPRGVEVLVGMTRDATFGPCIVFGAGGVHAEILDDFAFRVAPLGEADARAMIAETRVAKILAGARGEPPADLDALVDVILRLSRLACAHPEIAEVDLNPVFAGPAGACLVDARIILSTARPAAGGRGAEAASG